MGMYAGVWPTQNGLLFSHGSQWEPGLFLCHPERSQEPALGEVEGDLQFCRLVLEMFFEEY